MHGVVGGGVRVAEGGSFKDGFLACAIAEALPINSLGFGSNRMMNIAGRTAAAAVVGGTVSSATGGNFANGARSAAFAELFNSVAHEVRDTTTGKYKETVFASGALQVEAYSTATLFKGNSNIEQVIDIRSERPLSTIHKGTFFDASYGQDGSATCGTSTLSFGATADNRYITDISIPIGSKSSIGVTYYFDPRVIQNNVEHIGNILAQAKTPRVFPMPGMPIPAFP